MIYIVAGVALLLVGIFEPAFRLVSTPLGLLLSLHGVGGELHKAKRHVLGYFATFLGVVAAIYTAPLFDFRGKALLSAVAFGFFLNSARFFSRRLKRVLAPAAIVAVAAPLGLFIQAARVEFLAHVVWGAGAAAAATSALGLAGGRVGRFFARRVAVFGVLGGLAVALYYVSALVSAPWLVSAAAVAAVVLLLGGTEKRPRVSETLDDPHLLEAVAVERRFLKSGDVSLLAAYVAYHMARGGADQTAVLKAVKTALSYRDLEPSPLAPPLVVRLIERLNRRRRERHLRRLKSLLKSYL